MTANTKIDPAKTHQALEHKHPMKLAVSGRNGRREFEYVRHGARTLFAAFNPHTGEVFAQCSRQRRLVDLLRFMEGVAKCYPSGTVTVIWDNLNIHSPKLWAKFNERHGGRFRFLYTPLHASWVNQVVIWFAILARCVLNHGSFRSAAQLQQAVLGFVWHWNQYEAHPFRWTFRGTFSRAA